MIPVNKIIKNKIEIKVLTLSFAVHQVSVNSSLPSAVIFFLLITIANWCLEGGINSS